MASTRDLTSLALIFPDGKGEFDLLVFFWCPELTARERVRKDGVNYDLWIRDGYIFETEGNVVDYGYIRRFISGYKQLDGTVSFDENCLSKKYAIQSIAFDRWNSSQLVIDLQNDGATLTPFGQGFASMSTPTKEFEKLILTSKVRHFGNPVLRWQVGNVQIKTDPSGNQKPDKDKSSEKIDGIVASIMALGEYMTFNKSDESIYTKQPMRFL